MDEGSEGNSPLGRKSEMSNPLFLGSLSIRVEEVKCTVSVITV